MFEKIRKLFQKDSTGSGMRSNVFGAQDAAWKIDQGTDFADEGYIRNVIAFRCVNIIAQSLSSVPLRVKVGDEVADKNHPLVQLLDQPNITQAGSDFFEYYTAFRMIDGNTYLEMLKGSLTGLPTELWIWDPYNMQVIAKNGERVPRGYRYKANGVDEKWEIDQSTGDSDIIHWRSFNPRSRYYGLSAMRPGGMSIDQHNESSAWNMRSIQNSAVPTGLLKNTSAQGMTSQQAKNIRKEIHLNQEGPNNARKMLVVEGKLDYQPMGLSPIDMDFLNTHKNAANEIAAAFGVPLQVIPISGEQTFANYEQARLALWEDTVIPLLKEMIGLLNKRLSPLYGDDVKIFFSPRDIEALSKKQTDRLKDFEGISYLTINQKLEENGYPKSDNPAADELFQTAGQFPLGFDITEEEQEKAMIIALMDHKGLSEEEATKEARALIQSEK